jgi:predicted DNA-binding antitoxin AbrB/MazE fold protein
LIQALVISGKMRRYKYLILLRLGLTEGVSPKEMLDLIKENVLASNRQHECLQVSECKYEEGVFKPLQEVIIKEGTKLKIKVQNVDLSGYRGMFGKASAERLQELEGDAYL